MRIVVCGKGGSGKSTVVTLMARVLRDRGYVVHVVDGDPSNPGLYWMLGFEKAPEPLMDFYGGKQCAGGEVTCPVDDPTPLVKGQINLEELPGRYSIGKSGITLFRVGKIENVYEGCDGPESKIARDFRVPGDHVTLIDVTAGLEHFGRGVEVRADAIMSVVDPTATSFFLAKMAKDMVDDIKRGVPPFTAHMEDARDVEMARKIAREAKTRHAWTVMNKVTSAELESLMKKRLGEHGIEPIGSIRHDPEITTSCLESSAIRESGARRDLEEIVGQLESLVLQRPANLEQR